MKKIIYMVLATMVIASCTSNKKSEEAKEQLTSKAKKTAESIIKSEVEPILNPNLASGDAIGLALDLPSERVGVLLEGKPYQDPMEFLNKLKEVVGEEGFESAKGKLFLPMNLNTTAEDDFKQVPGVGDKMAHEFEEYRPYTSVLQFRREIGKYVSEEVVAGYENYVFVPVNLNTATEEEILAIPGVGKKMAHEFEEYRPYKNIEQFRREIGKYVDEDEVARLERYVTL